MNYPPLPVEQGTYWISHESGFEELVTGSNYSADQLIEYGEACVAHAQQELTDDQIDEAVTGIFHYDYPDSQQYDRAIARAVLALRNN